MSILTHKQCTKCGEEKELSEFHKTNQIKSGYSSICENCYREYHVKYYYKNKDIIKERAKKHYLKNRDKHLLDVKNWVNQNRDKSRNFKKIWKQNNPTAVREQDRLYRKNHPEKSRLDTLKRRARIISNGGEITEEEWSNLREYYRNTCLCCGRKEPEIKIELDHVIPLAVGGKHVIENAQTLCRSCNSSKGAKHIDFRPLFETGKSGCEG